MALKTLKIGSRIKVQLSSLDERVYVRTEVPHDAAERYRIMMQAGGMDKCPPIVVTPSLVLVDGRIRKFVAEGLRMKELWAIVEPEAKSNEELLIRSFQHNLNDGPQPSSKSDMLHMMRQLLRLGMTQKKLMETCVKKFEMLPGTARSLVNSAAATTNRDARARVFDHLAKGKSVKEIAHLENIPLDRVVGIINKEKGADILRTMRGNLTTKFKAVQDRLMVEARKFEDCFREGVSPKDDVLKYYTFVFELAEDLRRVTANRANRFQKDIDAMEKKNATSTIHQQKSNR